jgi:hypothetical protein
VESGPGRDPRPSGAPQKRPQKPSTLAICFIKQLDRVVLNTRHHYYSRPHALSATKTTRIVFNQNQNRNQPTHFPTASSHFSRRRCGKSASSSLGSDCEKIRNVSLLRACACSSDDDWNQASTHTSSTCCTLSVGLYWFFPTKPLDVAALILQVC